MRNMWGLIVFAWLFAANAGEVDLVENAAISEGKDWVVFSIDASNLGKLISVLWR